MKKLIFGIFAALLVTSLFASFSSAYYYGNSGYGNSYNDDYDRFSYHSERVNEGPFGSSKTARDYNRVTENFCYSNGICKKRTVYEHVTTDYPQVNYYNGNNYGFYRSPTYPWYQKNWDNSYRTNYYRSSFVYSY